MQAAKITISAAFLLASCASAQKVEVWQKGANQPEQIDYGQVSFPENATSLTVSSTVPNGPGGALTSSQSFDLTSTQIVITPGAQDPSAPVNEAGSSGAASWSLHPKDTVLMQYQVQQIQREEQQRQAVVKADQAAMSTPTDLRTCHRVRGIDRLYETFSDQPPTSKITVGELVSITGEAVWFKANTDTAAKLHRLDEVTRIEISYCR